MRLRSIGFLFALALAFSSLTRAQSRNQAPFQAVDLDAGLTPGQLAARLAAKRVVFIGEIHNRYEDHLNQLAIIRRLHGLHPRMVIGVEYFQQAFQPYVSDYIEGKIPVDEFLRKTEYFQRWGYDYRLYAPIFRYARAEHIPVRALNVPTSLVVAVAKVGFAGLSARQRAELPRTMKPAGKAYRKILHEAFEEHHGMTFPHFVEAQLVWDEGMAQSASEYLNAHKNIHMVILAGAGHLEFGYGIPRRLERRTHASYAIVLNSGEGVRPRMADYLLISKRRYLPPAGRLGLRLKNKNGQCRIVSVTAGGAAEKAGIRKGDVVVAIDGQMVKDVADAKVALWNKAPGEVVRVAVRRKRFFRHPKLLNFKVKLTASPKAPPGTR